VINIKRIVYATDFSPYSNQAYFHAITLAESHEASLTILHVFTAGQPAGAERDRARAFWRQQLEQIRPVNPHIPVHHVLLEGDPAEQIIRFGAENATDLIVLGTHGRTGVERQVMGSVAEKVMGGAACSVLVVKMPRTTPVTPHREVAALRN
jgi:nucleotide-binding universal stress UspA family protein